MPTDSPTRLASPHRVQELDRLGDAIAELAAHLDAATARLLDLIREFDARGGWNSGFRSCAHWLSWRVGLDLGAARERVRVARALGTLPRLSEALRGGRAVLRQGARPDPRGHAGDGGASPRGGARRHRGPRRAHRAGLAPRGPKRRSARGRGVSTRGRSLQVYQDEDGTVVIRGRLAPEVGALLLRALDAAREVLYQRSRPPGRSRRRPTQQRSRRAAAQQQADALALLAETALHHELDPGAPGERYQVVVHVDAAVLADPTRPGQSVLEEGEPRFRGNVPAPGLRREPGGDAARSGGPSGRGRRPDPDDSARAAAGAAASGPRAAASRAATCGSGRAITCATGRRAARPPWQISRCSVAATIARSTRRDTRSRVDPTARCSSDGRTAGCCPRCHRRRRCLPIRLGRCGRSTTRKGCGCMRGRRARSWLGERLDVGWAIGVASSGSRSAARRPGRA